MFCKHICTDDVWISVGGMLQRLLATGWNRIPTATLLGRCCSMASFVSLSVDTPGVQSRFIATPYLFDLQVKQAVKNMV